MWQIYRMMIRYKYLLPDLIQIIEMIQASGSDRKLTKTERGQILSAFSKLITKAHPSNDPRGHR